jgi:hypothetical protein
VGGEVLLAAAFRDIKQGQTQNRRKEKGPRFVSSSPQLLPFRGTARRISFEAGGLNFTCIEVSDDADLAEVLRWCRNGTERKTCAKVWGAVFTWKCA